MKRFPWFLRWGLALALVCGLGLQVGGCDGGASKRVSQYSRLEGTWRILSVELRGAELTLRDTVQIEFLPSGEQGRYYRLLRPSQHDPVAAEGEVDMPEANVLQMTEGFSRPLLWTFDFDQPNDLTTSVRFFLESRGEGSSQAFLNAIGRSGNVRVIAMDLERESD